MGASVPAANVNHIERLLLKLLQEIGAICRHHCLQWSAKFFQKIRNRLQRFAGSIIHGYLYDAFVIGRGSRANDLCGYGPRQTEDRGFRDLALAFGCGM